MTARGHDSRSDHKGSRDQAMALRTCTECGTVNPPERRFCSSCGSLLDAAGASAPAASAARPDPAPVAEAETQRVAPAVPEQPWAPKVETQPDILTV